MKKSILCIFLGLLCLNAFSHNGVLFGEKKLQVAKTEWFDIIYSEQTQETAAILYNNADEVYKEVAGQYGLEPSFRMPVVLTSAVESFNAYWSNYPYNHIVIYDTGVIAELNVFSKTVLSTFRHELTHAVTYNMKSPLWKGIEKVLGDPVSLSALLVTSGMAEGATLTSESAAGEGRLNDEFAKQYVKQAKIDGEFPNYFDIQGASDIYPVGSFYFFNGAFHQWLQEKYGLEAYADLWYRCVNFKGIVIEAVFKKVYNISLKTAWEMFREDYKIPSIPSNPVEAGIVKDFFLPEAESYSLKNKNGNLYSSLTAGKNGFAYLEENCGGVFYVPFEKMQEGSVKVNPKKIFSVPGVQNIKMSASSRYIAVDYIKERNGEYKKSIKLYDLEKKSFFNINEEGIQEGSVIENNGELYLVFQKFKSQRNAIKIARLIVKNDHIRDIEEGIEIPCDFEVVPSGFTDLGNGKFAFLKKNGTKYSICTMDIPLSAEEFSIKEYSLDEDRFVIRYPSYDGENLLFSYTLPGTMPRLGKLNLATGKFELDKRDISGGVYYPVKIAENKIAYAGNFLRYNRLFVIEESGEKTVRVANTQVIDKVETKPVYTSSELDEQIKGMALASKKYNPFAYYRRGLILPGAEITSYSFDIEHLLGTYPMMFGLTYISSNPWSDGNIQIGAAIGPLTRSAGVSLAYTSSSWIDFGIMVENEFDLRGWKQVNSELILSKNIPFGGNNYGFITSDTFVHYGRSNIGITDPENFLNIFTGDATAPDMNMYFYEMEQLQAGISTGCYTGPGRYDKLAFVLAGVLSHSYNCNGNFQTVYWNSGEVGIGSKLILPKLIPIDCVYGMTYNLPTEINLNVLSSTAGDISFRDDDFFEDYNFVNLSAKTVLFGKEIQKSLFNMTGLFVSNIEVSLTYKTGLNDLDVSTYLQPSWNLFYAGNWLKDIGNGTIPLKNKFYLSATVSMVPNIGGFASYQNKLDFSVRAGFISDSTNALKPCFDTSFKTTM